MSNTLERWGRFVSRHHWAVIGTWIVLALVVVASAAQFGRDLKDPFGAPGLDSHQATELLARAGADEAGLTAQVVLTPTDSEATFLDPGAARADVAVVQDAMAALPSVLTTSDPASALATGRGEAAGHVSPDGRVAIVRVQYEVAAELDPADLTALKQRLAELESTTSLQIEAGGDLFFAFEEPPAGISEGVGLLVAMIVLLVAFGTIVAMGLPIGTALLGLAVGVGSLPLVSHVVEVPSWSTVMGSMIGLGVGIDYALFVLTRFREHLADGSSTEDAVARSLATAGRAVILAGGTVVVAITGLAAARIPFVTSGGIAISIVVLVMVAASVTLLPALLTIAGHRVVPRRSRRNGHGDGWRRWGTHVTRHARAYAVGGSLVLLVLAAPVLSLRLGFPDEGTMPQSRTERRAYDLVSEGFGPGANGPLVIAVDLADDPSVVAPLTSAVAADPGVASVSVPQMDRASDVATLVATPTTPPQEQATRDTIERLRSEVFPTVLGNSPAQAHIGGQVATFADLGHRVEDRLPVFVAAVVGLSFVLLLLAFKSVLVPLKAALMNLLSVSAAYGVLVMVFQWGWGGELIGLEGAVPILSFIPLFMFAILFGLSMDYEVFLLSRIREEYLRTGDNGRAVISGLAGTARTITAAALIMVAVFGGFVLGEDPLAKMLGLGLATAILIDATLVRLVLVPATMTLLGRANWWLPRFRRGTASSSEPVREHTSVSA